MSEPDDPAQPFQPVDAVRKYLESEPGYRPLTRDEQLGRMPRIERFRLPGWSELAEALLQGSLHRARHPRGRPRGSGDPALRKQAFLAAYRAALEHLGHPPTQEQFAERLACSERTVRRKLIEYGLAWPPT